MAKYAMKGNRVFGNTGTHVDFSLVKEVLSDFNLESKWDSKADDVREAVQLRDVADGEDRFLLTKRFNTDGRGFILIAKVDEKYFMVSQGSASDWEGCYAIKVTQQELEELFK